MKWSIKCLLVGIRGAMADMLGQILALVMFIAAGLAWLYFSTIYAVIPVIVIGVVVGGLLYGWVEGTSKADVKSHRDNAQ